MNKIRNKAEVLLQLKLENRSDLGDILSSIIECLYPYNFRHTLENALWRMVLMDGHVNIELPEADQKILENAEPEHYRNVAERLSDGISNTDSDELNLAIYIWYGYHHREMALRLQLNKDHSTARFNEGLIALGVAFRNHNLPVTNCTACSTVQRVPTRLTVLDIASLLRN